MTVNVSPTCTFTSVSPTLMVSLSPWCQPKLPVENSFTIASVGWPLMVTSTLLAWARNWLWVIGHTVLDADMANTPSCGLWSVVGGRTTPTRKALPLRKFAATGKLCPQNRDLVKSTNSSRGRAKAAPGLQDLSQPPQGARVGPPSAYLPSPVAFVR